MNLHDVYGVSPGRNADLRRLLAAFGLILAFMVGETTAGFLANSLALLSDAAHMLTDAAAIALSIVAIRLAARPPAGGLTYGLKRAEILAALANGTALFVLALVFTVEAAARLASPPKPNGQVMLIVALAGVGVNLAATLQLARADHASINVKGAFLHILNDLWAFIGTALAAVFILTLGFVRADPIASLLVAGLMIYTSVGLVRKTVRVLMEAVPEGMDIEEIGAALSAHAEVTDVHDLHVWEITSRFPALSAHVLVRPGRDCHAVRRDLEAVLAERFGIDHTTLQVDHDEGYRGLRISTKQ